MFRHKHKVAAKGCAASGAGLYVSLFALMTLGVFVAAAALQGCSTFHALQALGGGDEGTDAQDIVALHAREDLLLNNYSWLNDSEELSLGKVRIPIDRAMELLAHRGLPLAPATEQAPPMTGDEKPAIAVPLTSGFARAEHK
jgi:hypothetical protein